MIEELQRLFGRYPELLLAWDDAKQRLHGTMVIAANKDDVAVKEAGMDLEKAEQDVATCKHDAATAWMWGFRCAIEHYPELKNLVNELLPTPEDGSVWDRVGV